MIDCYVVDAFTDKLFFGNPAAVLFLEKSIDEKLMQNIASENNLSETAFVLRHGNEYTLRWFTPKVEVDLCGHATLATAFVLSNFYDDSKKFIFNTKSGKLIVSKDADKFFMRFPTYELHKVPTHEKLLLGLKNAPNSIFVGKQVLAVFDSYKDIENLQPDFEVIKQIPEGEGVFVTAKGYNSYDFVARAFWPKLGVNEDPVCGSMFCYLAPYWANKLAKKHLFARQLSSRGGDVWATVMDDDTVAISGHAVLYSKNKLHLHF